MLSGSVYHAATGGALTAIDTAGQTWTANGSGTATFTVNIPGGVLPGTGELYLVIDAIDSLNPKVNLLVWCREQGVPVIASLGAAGKADVGAVRTGDLFASTRCALARPVRARLRRRGVEGGIPAVWSIEPGDADRPDAVKELGDAPPAPHRRGRVRHTLASQMTIPGVFGYALAALALLALRLLWGFIGTEEARFSAFPLSLSGVRAHVAKLLRGEHGRQQVARCGVPLLPFVRTPPRSSCRASSRTRASASAWNAWSTCSSRISPARASEMPRPCRARAYVEGSRAPLGVPIRWISVRPERDATFPRPAERAG